MNNPNNVLLTKFDVEEILNKFGNIGNNNTRLKINDLNIYQSAFVHESYHQSILNMDTQNTNAPIYCNYISVTSNERLEFLGDHVLKTCVGKYLYTRFPNEREGFLTRLKIKIEKCSMLHQMAVELGFKKYLLLSLQIENQNILGMDRGRNTPAFYEDSFEAFLGALITDFGEYGYIYADRFIVKVIENVVDFAELIYYNDNFKDSLQRFYQHLKFKTPVYTTISQTGPLYRRIFTRGLTITQEQFLQLSVTQQTNILKYTNEAKINCVYEPTQNGYLLCIGSGKKVVQAEQNAAKIGLEILGLDLNY